MDVEIFEFKIISVLEKSFLNCEASWLVPIYQMFDITKTCANTARVPANNGSHQEAEGCFLRHGLVFLGTRFWGISIPGSISISPTSDDAGEE